MVQRDEQVTYGAGVRAERVVARRGFRIAMARQIRRDHGKSDCQAEDQRSPRPAGAPQSMDQQHHGPASRPGISEFAARQSHSAIHQCPRDFARDGRGRFGGDETTGRDDVLLRNDAGGRADSSDAYEPDVVSAVHSMATSTPARHWSRLGRHAGFSASDESPGSVRGRSG